MTLLACTMIIVCQGIKSCALPLVVVLILALRGVGNQMSQDMRGIRS